VKNDFNSQPGLAALLDRAKSDRQLSAIGVYGYWAVSVSSPIPWQQRTQPFRRPCRWPGQIVSTPGWAVNQAHLPHCWRRWPHCCSRRCCCCPRSGNRRNHLMSVAVCRCPVAGFPAWVAGELLPGELQLQLQMAPRRSACRVSVRSTRSTVNETRLFTAHTSAVQRQRELTTSVSFGQDFEATITRAATGTGNKLWIKRATHAISVNGCAMRVCVLPASWPGGWWRWTGHRTQDTGHST